MKKILFFAFVVISFRVDAQFTLDLSFLKNRANHTGLQSISTVTGLQDSLTAKFSNGGNSFGGTSRIGNNDNYDFILKTNNATRYVVTAAGHMYSNGTKFNLGSASFATANFRDVLPLTGATTYVGHLLDGVVQTDVTANAYYRRTVAGTAPGATVGGIVYNMGVQGTFGSGSSVNAQYVYYLDNTVTGATYNYGYYSLMPSGANNYGLYFHGTARNYLNGNLGILDSNAIYPLTVGLGGLFGVNSSGKIAAYPGADANGKILVWNASTSTFDAVNISSDTTVNIVNGEGSVAVSVDTNAIATKYYAENVIKTTTLTASGDGSSSSVDIALPASATWVMIGAKSEDAGNIKYWTVSGTDLTIYYDSPPAAGTNNLEYWIQYK